MSKIKDFLGQEALDALELVDEGLMTVDEWYKRYLPNYSYDDHDCHAEGGESGCDHPAHGEDIV